MFGGPDSSYDFDDFVLLVNDLSAATTYEYDDANELTSQTDKNGTVTFGYDAWGRMTSKSRGGYSATYVYRYGSKLFAVSSDFPGEGTATYAYGGDGKRRLRTVGATTTKYNWDMGWNVISEEDGVGTLTMSYVIDQPGAPVASILADVSGTNPASGTYRYYNLDHLGSTRRLRAQDKSDLGQYEYTPYGDVYAESGVTLADLGGAFTGKPWDDTAQLYYFPYRYYSPTAARWLTRDPLGMVDGPNVYAYVGGNVLAHRDLLGLKIFSDWIDVGIGVAGLVLTVFAARSIPATGLTGFMATLVGAAVVGFALLDFFDKYESGKKQGEGVLNKHRRQLEEAESDTDRDCSK